MKIEYLYEAGTFGSYKNVSKQSNLDSVKRELAREASLSVLQNRCDELAELFLDMLNDVSLETSSISGQYKYKTNTGTTEKYIFLELSNCVVNRAFNMAKSKKMQLNIIKNVYCNIHAIEYMMSHECFILPLVDTTDFSRYKNNDSKDIIPYKNMTKAVAEAAEKIIKSHLSKFPSYASVIPNKVKIVIVRDVFNAFNLDGLDYSGALELYKDDNDSIEHKLLPYMGFTGKGVIFKYPGKGNSCLKYIIDNCTLLPIYCNITPTKENAPILKAMADPSPWMFNKIVINLIRTDLPTVIDNNFYSIKLLKFAVDKGILVKKSKEYPSSLLIFISIKDVIKNLKEVKILKREISNSGLNNYVTYDFNVDRGKAIKSFMTIGKELSVDQAEQERINIDNLKRRVYEFDCNNSTEIESIVTDFIKECDKVLTDDNIKQIVEANMKKSLQATMKNILKFNSFRKSSSNKILLCDIFKNDIKCNLMLILDPGSIELNKNLVIHVNANFCLAGARGYIQRTSEDINIEIPL